MRRPRAGEIVFVYQNNERNESVTLAGKMIVIYIWKIEGKVAYIWKIMLSRP